MTWSTIILAVLAGLGVDAICYIFKWGRYKKAK